MVTPTRIMTYFPSYCMCVLFSNVSHLCTVFQSLEIRDQCYVEAIETLQRLSTCLTPAEKLEIVQLTFDKINEVCTPYPVNY